MGRGPERGGSERGGEREAPGVYLHVPFCSAICPYCDFAVTRGDRSARRAFVERLVREIEQPREPAWRADTVYFGGGTPSSLDPEGLATILAALADAVELSAETAIHFEANPEDVDAASVAAWRGLGVRFLSLGVQSFDDARLRFLGRRHDGAAARRAVEIALAAGFETVSLDLIYALPDDPWSAVERDLETAAALGVQHLSAYELTVHQGTPFARWRDRGKLVELPEDGQAELLLRTHRRLAQLGYEGYEISNFALAARHRSRHNSKYWRFVPYLGLGPSAHSFDGARRWWNLRDGRAWARQIDAGASPVAEVETLDRKAIALEALMLGLRTRAGVDLAALARRVGEAPALDRAALERAVEGGLVEVVGERLVPSLEGMALADRLAVELGAKERGEG